MRARIFRMHWRVGNRLPSRFAFGRRIVVDIAIANRSDRAPEVVVVLGVEYRNAGIRGSHGYDGHEPRTVDQIHLLSNHDLPSDRIGALRAGDKPETSIFGLSGGTAGAVSRAECLDLIVVLGPFRAFERNRRLCTELRRALQGEWFQVWPRRGHHRWGRNVDTRSRLRPIRVRSVRAVIRARTEDFGGDRLAQRDPLRLC